MYTCPVATGTTRQQFSREPVSERRREKPRGSSKPGGAPGPASRSETRNHSKQQRSPPKQPNGTMWRSPLAHPTIQASLPPGSVPIRGETGVDTFALHPSPPFASLPTDCPRPARPGRIVDILLAALPVFSAYFGVPPPLTEAGSKRDPCPVPPSPGGGAGHSYPHGSSRHAFSLPACPCWHVGAVLSLPARPWNEGETDRSGTTPFPPSSVRILGPRRRLVGPFLHPSRSLP